jgi:LuxR family maltose regulon positive regulatory protein
VLVARRRLIALLQQGLRLPLTLVVAPAGFGKTTLVAGLVGHMSETKVAWLSCDVADNDPARFWSYLLGACERAWPGVATPAMALLQTPQAPPLEAMATALLNALAESSDSLVLVLDDYHLIENATIHESLSFLLEHQLPSLHLVLITRSRPPLPLARLRARGQLLEVEAEALRFQTDEAAHFFADTMGLKLSPELVAALERRTEGWAAGMQLAALSIQGLADVEAFVSAFSGSNRFILEYLLNEVLSRQSEATQQFLIATSILTRLCARLCAALMTDGAADADADRDAAQMLTHLERSNLFLLRSDEEGQWFRYHQLFAEALQKRLLQTKPELLPALHTRAAQWWLQHDFWSEAIHHAQASGDTGLLAEVLEAASGPLLMSGQAGELWRRLNQLPAAEAQRRPALNLFYGWAALLSGQAALVEPYLRLVEAAANSVDSDEAVAWLGQVAAIRSYRQVTLGDVARALATAQPAIDALPVYDPLMRAVIGMNLGAVYVLAGQLAQAERLLTGAEDVARSIDNPWIALAAQEFLGQVRIEQADIERAEATFQAILATDASAPHQRLSATLALTNIRHERNNLTAAKELARQLVLLARQFGMPEWLALSLLTTARIAWAEGDETTARALLAEAVPHEQHCRQPTAREVVTALRLRLALTMGETPPETDWLPFLDNPAGVQSLQQTQQYLAAAHSLLVANRNAEAETLLRAMLAFVEPTGRVASVIETLALLSLATHAQGRHDEAGAALRRAVALGAAAGYVRTFVDLGPPMQRLLTQQRSVSPYVQTLLAAFPPPKHPTPTPLPVPRSNPALVEQLNERELEVLRLVAAGHSNSEIASTLIIAVGTVKKHLNNIFGKLGVSSRTQAVARANELGLFED